MADSCTIVNCTISVTTLNKTNNSPNYSITGDVSKIIYLFGLILIQFNRNKTKQSTYHIARPNPCQYRLQYFSRFIVRQFETGNTLRSQNSFRKNLILTFGIEWPITKAFLVMRSSSIRLQMIIMAFLVMEWN